MTCFRHYDILAKTRSRMTTAVAFSRQNDTGSRVSNYSVLRKSRTSPRLRILSSPFCNATTSFPIACVAGGIVWVRD